MSVASVCAESAIVNALLCIADALWAVVLGKFFLDGGNMDSTKYRSYRRERAPLSPETLQEMMKFLADAPAYYATWRENGNYYAAKKTEDGRLVLLRNMERVPKRQIRLSAKRVLCENWEVVHFNVE